METGCGYGSGGVVGEREEGEIDGRKKYVHTVYVSEGEKRI
jgi:hypothetical protein